MSWKTLKIEEKLYALRIVKNFVDIPEHSGDPESLLTIWLSDFRVIYKEQLKLRELLDRAKAENPIVEYQPSIVLDTILNGISPQLQLVYEETASVFRLKCKYYVSQLPFHFHWRLELQAPEVFFEEITKLLIGSLLDAQTQTAHLLDVIQSKDLEIEQYKIDGAELIRKQLATKPFVRNAFEQSAHSAEVGSLLQIAKDETRALGITIAWSMGQPTSSPDQDSRLVQPIKRPSSTSPGKPIKRTAKEILARSKIQSGPDASVEYGDNNDEEEDDPEAKEQRTLPADSSITISPAKSINSRKIKTKLNL